MNSLRTYHAEPFRRGDSVVFGPRAGMETRPYKMRIGSSNAGGQGRPPLRLVNPPGRLIGHRGDSRTARSGAMGTVRASCEQSEQPKGTEPVPCGVAASSGHPL